MHEVYACVRACAGQLHVELTIVGGLVYYCCNDGQTRQSRMGETRNKRRASKARAGPRVDGGNPSRDSARNLHRPCGLSSAAPPASARLQPFQRRRPPSSTASHFIVHARVDVCLRDCRSNHTRCMGVESHGETTTATQTSAVTLSRPTGGAIWSECQRHRLD